jgi:LmbE family N-acetylglucosaminyl deacetylase
MSQAPRLLLVVAHPDDETFGCGSIIALAREQGADVIVCSATRGEAGDAPSWLGEDRSLGEIREAELCAAGELLGVSHFVMLDFADSGMDGLPAAGTLAAAGDDAVIEAVHRVIDEVNPDVVVTLDPDHGDGHRDHVVIGRATTAACAATPDIRLYYYALSRPLLARWFDELATVRPDGGHLDRIGPVSAGPKQRSRPGSTPKRCVHCARRPSPCTPVRSRRTWTCQRMWWPDS